ncbi:hypothetical protein BV22DRAFT_980980, partial [Leucogyrophana mollusca]
PYHTSILTGEAWVLELLTGHPDRARHNLCVSVEQFEELVRILRQNGHSDSKKIKLEEKLA